MPCARCNQILAERDALAERARQLEAILGDREWVPQAWRLTAMEARILKVLVARPLATYGALIDAIYWDRETPDDPKNVLVVRMVSLRRKLPAEVIITTVWGQGYSLDDVSRLMLAEIIKVPA